MIITFRSPETPAVQGPTGSFAMYPGFTAAQNPVGLPRGFMLSFHNPPAALEQVYPIAGALVFMAEATVSNPGSPIANPVAYAYSGGPDRAVAIERR